MSIEYALLKCSEIVKRKLTGAETLIVGIAYQMGYGAGMKNNNKK